MQLWHAEFCRLQLKLLRVPISYFKFNVGSRHARWFQLKPDQLTLVMPI